MKKQKIISAENAADLGVFALLAIYPLIITDRYFNLTLTKYIFFTVTSAFFFALCLIIKIYGIDNHCVIKKPELSNFSLTDIFITLFTLIATISCFSSEHVIASISGGAGRRMGLIMIFSLFFAYMFISKFYRIKENDFMLFGAVSIFMSFVALLQYNGVNVFSLQDGLSDWDKYRFLSFSGNINIFSSFICIALSLSMYMFCF